MKWFRRHTKRSGATSYDLVALHLSLLIAMAAADGQLRMVEIDELAEFVEQATLRSAAEQHRLESLFKLLLVAPPELDRLLEEIAHFDRLRTAAAALVDDLSRIAHADDELHPREQDLLHRVCGALDVAPPTLTSH